MDATMRESIFIEALPTRVGHLEESVKGLHQDFASMQGHMAGMAAQMTSMTEVVKDIDSKLDIARTRRPDMNAMASWAAVLLVIVGLVFGGVAWRMSTHEVTLNALETQKHAWTYEQGYDDAVDLFQTKEIDRLRERLARSLEEK